MMQTFVLVVIAFVGQGIAELIVHDKRGDAKAWLIAFTVQLVIYYFALWFAERNTFGETFGAASAAVFFVRWGFFMYRLPKSK